MTIPSTASEIAYAGDDVSDEFAIPFVFDTAADLKVIRTDPDGNPQPLSSGFSVSGGGGSNGTLTLDDPLESGYTLTILDDPDLTQPVDYADNDAFPAETHEGALDRTVRQVKRLYQLIQLSLRVVDGDPSAGAGTELASVQARKGKYLFFNAVTGAIEYAVSLVTTTLSQSIIGELLYPQTAAESSAGVTPTNYQYEPGDLLRYGWAVANTGAQNAIALAAAASVWTQGGPKIRVPSGTYNLESFVVPAGRGLIIEGHGPNATKLVHSTGGSMFTLGADNIQLFVLENIYVEPSVTTAALLDWSGDFQAYGFRLKNVELHQGTSGNTSCVAYQVVGGSTPGSHEKHYFDINGLKIFGMGTGIKMDGSTAACNDLDARAVQIQGCANDGILLNESSSNRIIASIENCGDGTIAKRNLRILGSTSGDNRFWGRLENFGSPNEVLYVDPACDVGNFIHCTLSASPTPANDLCIPGGVHYHLGLEFSDIERRNKGLHRQLGDASTDIVFVTALSSDTMGGRGRFGIEADGRLGWSNSSAPSAWDAELRYSPVDGAVRVTGTNFRAPILELTDGVTTPTTKGGFALIYVDSADGDLKIKFGDGTVKTIVVDT